MTIGKTEVFLEALYSRSSSGGWIMGSSYRLRALLIVSMAWMSSSPLLAADQAQPILDGRAAMNIALKLAAEATHSHNYSTQDIRFEPSTREWTVQIEASLDSNAMKRFVATVNESTGLACLQLPPAAGCVARENIQPMVANAQAKAETMAMARKFPAPDLQHLAEVLLRYQVGADRSHGGGAVQARYFVNLPSPDAKGLVDLSPDITASLKQDGIETYPGNAWKEGTGGAPMSMRFSIGLPVRRPDGNYDVPYNYYCGPFCAGWYTAVVKHDAGGWHVVSSVMNAVS